MKKKRMQSVFIHWGVFDNDNKKIELNISDVRYSYMILDLFFERAGSSKVAVMAAHPTVNCQREVFSVRRECNNIVYF